jgi:predicted regulator of Ras-like GTPase activity (Roadblock/LC7/MglB family)
MNSIHDILAELRVAPSVKGAAVVTSDGLVASESLDERYRSDVVSGLSSYLMMTTNRSLREGGLGACNRFVLHATHGKAVFVALKDSYLVVLFDQFADLGAMQDEIGAVATRLLHSTRLG